jgi:beta porphyranase A C-terminal/Porphyranase catalytic subdomain 1/Secretion system C-terminal sorting domain
MNPIKTISIAICTIISFPFYAQSSNVKIDAKILRFIGGVSLLDRSKYFNLHDGVSGTEENNFYATYNVNQGRGFWGPFAYSKSKGNPAGVYPAPSTANNTTVRNVKRFVLTEHPNNPFFDGVNNVNAANWAVDYFKNTIPDIDRPEFYELLNEPFVHAKDFYTGAWNATEEQRIKTQMSQLYKEVGDRFNATAELANMKIIGPSLAWTQFEKNDFSVWNNDMKLFMDIAGLSMHSFVTHLYDGINVTGDDRKVSGSNSEAVLDLIETYSFAKWASIKPHAITEFGGIEQGFGTNYSDIASSQSVVSMNHILFNLLERQDKLSIAIPFTSGKSIWHITPANNYQPYLAVLWKPSNIGQPNPTGWVYTPRVNFYKLWQEVKGERIYVKSDNPDIQSQAFVSGSKIYLALSNLDNRNQNVNLNFVSGLTNLIDVKIKSLKTYINQLPDYTDQTVTIAPTSITLIPDETTVLEYTFSSPIAFTNAVKRKNYHSATHLQAINANTDLTFNFNTVSLNTTGEAVLKMSLGRPISRSKKPIVTVNGSPVVVPDNWKGYDQGNMVDFFGTIDIPVPFHLIQANNEVKVKFPDSGGRVSSLILSVENFDIDILGIENNLLEKSAITFYPNPIKKDFKIDLKTDNSEFVQIEIYNMLGSLVYKSNEKNKKETINLNLEFLKSGIYSLSIKTDYTNQNFKIIKQ